MALKFDGNKPIDGILNDSANKIEGTGGGTNLPLEQIIKDGVVQWCKPYKITVGSLPDTAGTISMSRTETQEPTASTGELKDGDTVYRGDKISVSLSGKSETTTSRGEPVNAPYFEGLEQIFKKINGVPCATIYMEAYNGEDRNWDVDYCAKGDNGSTVYKSHPEGAGGDIYISVPVYQDSELNEIECYAENQPIKITQNVIIYKAISTKSNYSSTDGVTGNVTIGARVNTTRSHHDSTEYQNSKSIKHIVQNQLITSNSNSTAVFTKEEEDLQITIKSYRRIVNQGKQRKSYSKLEFTFSDGGDYVVALFNANGEVVYHTCNNYIGEDGENVYGSIQNGAFLEFFRGSSYELADTYAEGNSNGLPEAMAKIDHEEPWKDNWSTMARTSIAIVAYYNGRWYLVYGD